jgi:high potential iron-sulfur protein
MADSNFKPVRRRFLAASAALCGALSGAAGAAQPAPLKKYSKERVGYRDEPYQGRTCAKCVLYAGNGECAIVEGQVSPDGWCLQWMPATRGQAPTTTG